MFGTSGGRQTRFEPLSGIGATRGMTGLHAAFSEVGFPPVFRQLPG